MDDRSPYAAPSRDVGKPFEVPATNDTARWTWFWYVVYCVAMLLLSVLVAVIGVFLVAFADKIGESDEERLEMLITGAVYAVISVPFAIAFALAPFLKRGRLGWVYGIVMIALGMTSCCTVPICIPLLIFWLKPELRTFLNAR